MHQPQSALTRVYRSGFTPWQHGLGSNGCGFAYPLTKRHDLLFSMCAGLRVKEAMSDQALIENCARQP
jgi:hypothetical protein